MIIDCLSGAGIGAFCFFVGVWIGYGVGKGYI
jgi:hypothetical protein